MVHRAAGHICFSHSGVPRVPQMGRPSTKSYTKLSGSARVRGLAVLGLPWSTRIPGKNRGAPGYIAVVSRVAGGRVNQDMKASPSAPAPDELSAYGALLRRRWRLVAAGVLAGLILPGLYILIGPKTYTSTTRVLVTATGVQDAATLANGSTGDTEINLDTQAQIATSIVVARSALKSIDASIPPEKLLEEHVAVEIPPNSAVLAISYDASTPVKARAGARAFAKAYLDNRRNRAEETVEQRQRVLNAKIRKLTAQLEESTDKLATLPAGSSGYTYAQARRDLLSDQISTLKSKVSALGTTTITPGTIISPAQLPTGPSSPIIPLYLAGGLLVGTVAGAGAAMLRDRADARIRDAGDVERVARLPVLVEIPGKRQHTQPSLSPPRSQAGQTFHELSHSLGASLGYGNHVVLVTGACSGPGNSTVATNLAATLARTGSSTALVCADLQSSVSTWMLGLEPYPGLSDILLHGTRVSGVEQRPIEPSRLRVIAPGLDTEVASEQLQTQAMERLIGHLRQSATYIVVEAPATTESADAQALADLADVAIVVVEAPRAEREQVREGVRRLDRVGAAILGAVVVPTLEEPQVLRQRRVAVQNQPPQEQARPQTAPMPAVGPRAPRQRASQEQRQTSQEQRPSPNEQSESAQDPGHAGQADSAGPAGPTGPAGRGHTHRAGYTRTPSSTRTPDE